MNDTTIALRTKGQFENFLGKVFAHFKKPEKRFVGEMPYGIQASGSTMLSSIVRAIDDDVKPIMTEKRLSRDLALYLLDVARIACQKICNLQARGTNKSSWTIERLIHKTEILQTRDYCAAFETRR